MSAIAMIEQFERHVDSGERQSDRDAYHETLANVVSIRAGQTAVNPYLDPNSPRMNESNPFYPEWRAHVDAQPHQGC